MKRPRSIAFMALLSCLHAPRGEGTERKIVMDPYAYPQPTQDAHQPHAQQTDRFAQLPEDLYHLMAQFLDLNSLQNLRQTSKAHMKHVNCYMTPRIVMAFHYDYIPTLDMLSSRGFDIRKVKHIQLFFPHLDSNFRVSEVGDLKETLALLQNFSALETLEPVYLGSYRHSLYRDFSHLDISNSHWKVLNAEWQVMKRWTFLTSLDLRCAEIADADWDRLSQLTNLTSLGLGGNLLTDASLIHFQTLPNLTSLKLEGNLFTDAGIACLTNITSLDLFLSPQITGAGLARLTNLTSLTPQFPHDTRMGCYMLPIPDEFLSHLSSCTSLTSLTLGNQVAGSQLTNRGLTYLSALTNLTSLSILHTNGQGFAPLSTLTNLTSLDLSHNQLTDADCQSLTTLTNLTSLKRRYSSITAAGLSYLTQLTNLIELNLWANQITDTGLAHLSPLTNLTQLDLSMNRIGDDGLSALSPLTNLTKLYLSTNQITDTGLSTLSLLSNLTELNLWNTRITDTGLSALSPLTNLTTLGLSGNWITAQGKETLQTHLPNVDLMI